MSLLSRPELVELELGGMRVRGGGGGLLRRRSRQRSGGDAPLGWEMTALSGNRMADWWGALGGRRKECGLANRLVGLFQTSA